MKKLIVFVVSCSFFIGCNNDKQAKENTETVISSETKVMPVEIADAKYTEIGKAGLAALSSGDVDKWMSYYADNAVYVWNRGDSLVGKPAIEEYWKTRRNDVIETLTYSKETWLPIKVNQPQKYEQAGVKLLAWYHVDAKYKTGKSMAQWIHFEMHFNASDKIDRIVQYVDMAPINAATTN